MRLLEEQIGVALFHRVHRSVILTDTGREYAAEVTQESFRIHGGYGYSKEYEIERLMREAPFLLIGEGTSEIQKTIISRGLLKEYALKR